VCPVDDDKEEKGENIHRKVSVSKIFRVVKSANSPRKRYKKK
jgi:hypothetical protein